MEAELVAAEEDCLRRRHLYSGDSLAPLAAVVGRQPVRLYPFVGESVVLEDVQVDFLQHPE